MRYTPRTRSRSQHTGMAPADLAPDPKYMVERAAKALMRPSQANVDPLLRKKRKPRLPTFSWDK